MSAAIHPDRPSPAGPVPSRGQKQRWPAGPAAGEPEAGRPVVTSTGWSEGSRDWGSLATSIALAAAPAITDALDTGFPIRDAQVFAGHRTAKTSQHCDRRGNLDRHGVRLLTAMSMASDPSPSTPAAVSTPPAFSTEKAVWPGTAFATHHRSPRGRTRAGRVGELTTTSVRSPQWRREGRGHRRRSWTARRRSGSRHAGRRGALRSDGRVRRSRRSAFEEFRLGSSSGISCVRARRHHAGRPGRTVSGSAAWAAAGGGRPCPHESRDAGATPAALQHKLHVHHGSLSSSRDPACL